MDTKKIPGIYNYCDRWCERCCFTSRCAIYENESELSPAERDVTNDAFWKRFSENFDKAFALLHRAAREHGLDPGALQADPEDELQEERLELESREHPLAELSMQYAEVASAWLETQPGMVEKLEALRETLEMDSGSFASAKNITDSIRECLDVIRWYETLIPAKLMRSLMGRLRNTSVDSDDDASSFAPDHDGSVKVVLIAIERSTQAWAKLYELLPEREDDFLKVLAMLEKMKKMSQAEFPNAAKFRRPGFDD